MHLIYINEIGTDYKGQKQYEFIFSNSNELDVENWYIIPASSVIDTKSPGIEYVNMIGLLKDTDLVLELVQESDYFGIIDAVDGIIALGWEKYDYDNIDRLFFKFGESYERVLKKLKARKLNLVSEEVNIN